MTTRSSITGLSSPREFLAKAFSPFRTGSAASSSPTSATGGPASPAPCPAPLRLPAAGPALLALPASVREAPLDSPTS